MVGVRPSLAEIIDYARTREEKAIAKGGDLKGAERILLMADDKIAIKVAIAWMSMEPEWSMPSATLTVDRRSRWQRRPKRAMMWAWDGIDVDIEAIARAAAMPRFTAMITFNKLKEHLLIYPDGSLSPLAKMVVGQFTKRKLEAI